VPLDRCFIFTDLSFSFAPLAIASFPKRKKTKTKTKVIGVFIVTCSICQTFFIFNFFYFYFYFSPPSYPPHLHNPARSPENRLGRWFLKTRFKIKDRYLSRFETSLQACFFSFYNQTTTLLQVPPLL
jgi:hypothetical protein